MEEEYIEVRSEEVQEILSHVPNWIIRRGTALIFGIIAILMLATYFIKYPEIIVSKASIVTADPPVHMIAQGSGKVKLLVPNNAEVKTGEWLATIENPANSEDVRYLIEMLHSDGNSLTQQNGDPLQTGIDTLQFSLERPLLLGELQPAYINLKQYWLEYVAFKKDNYFPNKIRVIERQYQHQLSMSTKLGGQKEILSREQELSQNKYDVDKKLADQGAITDVERSQSEAEYLQKKYSLKNAEIGLDNSKIQLEEYRKTMLDLQQQYADKQRVIDVQLHEAVKSLQNAIAIWEQRYVIKATNNGKVSLFKYFTDDQFVTAGDEILTLLPLSERILAKVYVPSYGSGKIEKGQRVNIKLDSYPFKEYGIVEGRVESVSQVPRDNTYLVEVSLPQALKTSYGKTPEFKQEMTAQAEIITQDLRLIERLFNQIRSTVNK